MTEEDMQQALLQLADEIETANICVCDMDLEDARELYDVAQYLKHLVYMANGNA